MPDDFEGYRSIMDNFGQSMVSKMGAMFVHYSAVTFGADPFGLM